VARKKQHYVNNEKFLEVMSDYREKYLQAKDNDTELPIIPDYAGECFLKIAERLSHRPNFINYAFREEMVSDGIENSVMYASNFNPEKSTNPFAYFTQIIYYAFIKFGMSMGYNGVMSPLASAWMGNVLFSLGGILLLIFARK